MASVGAAANTSERPPTMRCSTATTSTAKPVSSRALTQKNESPSSANHAAARITYMVSTGYSSQLTPSCSSQASR